MPILERTDGNHEQPATNIFADSVKLFEGGYGPNQAAASARPELVQSSGNIADIPSATMPNSSLIMRLDGVNNGLGPIKNYYVPDSSELGPTGLRRIEPIQAGMSQEIALLALVGGGFAIMANKGSVEKVLTKTIMGVGGFAIRNPKISVPLAIGAYLYNKYM